MSAPEVVAAAVVAGAFMGLASELGYRLGINKSNLILIDGEFTIRRTIRKTKNHLVYPVGVVVHLVTSAVFGAIYFGITRPFEYDIGSVKVISPYVFFLWLAMLFVALPVAGQGLLGRRIGRFAWIEQLVIHIVFGIGFWWALETI